MDVALITLVDELIQRLEDMRVLRSKARRLKTYLEEVKKEIPRMKTKKNEVAVEIEQVLHRMLYIVQQLADKRRSVGSYVMSFFVARKELNELDSLEVELRRLLEAYKLGLINDVDSKLDAVLEELAEMQARENKDDLASDLREFKTSLREIENHPDYGSDASEITREIEALSDDEVDRRMRMRSRRNHLHKKLRHLTSTMSQTWQLESTNIKPGDLHVNDKEVLGRGTFGEVLAGELDGVPVAVKRAHLTSGLDLFRIQNDLVREAEGWKRLKHPNIVELLGTCVQSHRLLLVMEKCDLTLAFLIHDRDEDLTSELATTIIRGVARGLQYLHENNIIHRDVKPQNILLSFNLGKVKLTDFGLATVKADANASAAGTFSVRGSFPYLAPETLRAPARWTSKADLYALGVTIWETIEREPPWGTSDPFTIGEAVLAGRRPRFQRDAPWSNVLKELVELCWAQQASDRPTAVEVTATLSSDSIKKRRSTSVLKSMMELLDPGVHRKARSKSNRMKNLRASIKRRQVDLRYLEGVSGMREGEAEKVCKILRDYPQDQEIQWTGLGRINLIAMFQNHGPVFRLGGGELALAAMRNFREHGFIQSLGLLVLWRFSEHKQLIDNLVDGLHAASDVLEALRNHPRQGTAVVYRGLKFLENVMMLQPKHKAKLRDLGFPEVLAGLPTEKLFARNILEELNADD